MSKITCDKIKEYLGGSGKFIKDLVLEIYGDNINNAGAEAYSEAIEIGIVNTIASLYDANVNDKEIIRVLNKYWGINQSEAEDRIIYEKQEALKKELSQYMKMQGYSIEEVKKFMREHSVFINHEHRFFKLRGNPKKLMEELQNFKKVNSKLT